MTANAADYTDSTPPINRAVSRVILTPDDEARCEQITSRALGVVDAVARAVAEKTGLRLGEIMGQSRKRHVTEARHLIMFLAHRQGLSMSEIGRCMRRDHTTVLHGIRAERKRRGLE